MPIYEYRCENGDIFETMQSFSDEALTECEVCGAPVQRVMYAPAIHFKGGGFYNTDYKKKDSGSQDDSGSGSQDDSGGAKTTSTDAASTAESEKPATAKPEKTETKSTKAG